MKKIMIISITIMLCLVFASLSYAEGIEGRHEVTEASEKAVRGCKNALLCFLEVPNQVYKAGQEDGAGAAASVGLLKGIFMTPVRFVSGVLDITTCFSHTNWEEEMSFD